MEPCSKAVYPSLNHRKVGMERRGGLSRERVSQQWACNGQWDQCLIKLGRRRSRQRNGSLPNLHLSSFRTSFNKGDDSELGRDFKSINKKVDIFVTVFLQRCFGIIKTFSPLFSRIASFGVSLCIKRALFFLRVIRLNKNQFSSLSDVPIKCCGLWETELVYGIHINIKWYNDIYISIYFFTWYLKVHVWEMTKSFPPMLQMRRLTQGGQSCCPWVTSQLSEAGLGLSFLCAVLTSMHALEDLCSTVFACVSEASDLFLSRLIPERPLIDLPHF